MSNPHEHDWAHVNHTQTVETVVLHCLDEHDEAPYAFFKGGVVSALTWHMQAHIDRRDGTAPPREAMPAWMRKEAGRE